MKLQYFIHGLCLLQAVEAQTAKDHFDAVCDSQSEQSLTLGSGEQFTYICVMTAREGHSSIIDTLEIIGSSGACAESCAAVAECKGSTWNHVLGSCVLFKNAEDLEKQKKRAFLASGCEEAEVVLEDDLISCKLAHTSSEKAQTDLKETLEACEFERDFLESNTAPAQDCEKANTQIEDLKQELEQCKSATLSSALDLHECQSAAASGALELQQCNAAASSSGLPAFKDCNTGGDGQIVKIGNRNLKQRCNALMWKSQMSLRRVMQPGLNRLECALICALDAGCQSVYFVQSTSTVGECQLQQQNIESR
ncbi:uncharacterized protein N7477_001657 [Penicillium maclennaniae]|uniref:uncharacterized protein n=1 Tax=Penicillium maclennaniae TaxID=1343394 RepID=UPI00253F8EC5|nr:uncharacterized protein N7477_001657 [Penicillium maclennaniae]KAJ5681717.1 hypothetical protein N7477_001657 [Penicillium maclennaniae]